MKKLKLYIEVTNAAATAVGKKPEEVATIQNAAWQASGLETKQDRAMFEFLFTDAIGVCNAYAVQKLPSEAAAEKHGDK